MTISDTISSPKTHDFTVATSVLRGIHCKDSDAVPGMGHHMPYESRED